ncbi:MAG TPA: amidohydrolase family protein [Acidimicrobiales bacterium]|nr:amidohydrolase family protein [Acidimicrobiales bacterium]
MSVGRRQRGSNAVLRGATVVDGDRRPPRRADVRVEDGMVVQVGDGPGPLPAGDAAVVDLDGLVLAPGFIDPHTHYDAQVLWDPDLTPSSWHGVTTVVTGNCGFTLAPTPEACRGEVMEMLSVVEGMSRAALEAGIDWGFTSFPDYLDVVDGLPKRINVAAMVGHSALRYAALGLEAATRPATGDEIDRMRRMVDDALAAGAVGLSTSRSESHVGARARPVPSRAADPAEIAAVADPLRRRGAGLVEATWGPDLFVEELAALSDRLDRPVTWAAILTQPGMPEWTERIREATGRLPGQVVPQMAAKPLKVQIDLGVPGTMATVPAVSDALAAEVADRKARFADPAWRADAGRQVAATDWARRLSRAVLQESVAHADLVGGPTLGELAAAAGRTPFEALLDLALADDLRSRWSVALMNDADDELADMLGDDRLLLGLSDAGAHAAQLCDADAPTYLLGHWWRERGAISLEDAVWRLTAQPADLFGLRGRGRIAPGMVADLVAFDPDTVGGRGLSRRSDFPGGADRLVVESAGIDRVWVAGTEVCSGGRLVPGAFPGELLRAAA